MVASPLTVDIRHGAVDGLARLLAEGGISSGGRVAVLTGPGLGESLGAALQLEQAAFYPVANGSVDEARRLAHELRAGFDAVVGIGGGRTLDVAKYAASLVGQPMVAVATNLAHDGIASPVASLEHEGRKGSYGVHVPLAVFVDLDYVAQAPVRMIRAGIGDVVSNLSAVADWQLAAAERAESYDGLAASMAHTAAEAVVGRTDSVESPPFLVTLAEALVLSGMAMSVAGSSRPCSGGDHEIMHAIDQLYPGTSNHGELAGIGALFCAYLRDDARQIEVVDGCLRRHQLPRLPTDVGLSAEQFAAAVLRAPGTRPDRYTILEHLDLDDDDDVRKRIDGYLETFGR
jgi:glycerol-1-phosphate dehydrogenase [NAD(P)+]